MLCMVLVSHFESGRLQHLGVTRVLHIVTCRAQRVWRTNRRSRPDAARCPESHLREQAVDTFAVFDGLPVGIVEDGERELLAIRPADGGPRVGRQ